MNVWQPIETAPKDGRYILLAGPSGYINTPLRVEACRWAPKYRPLQPWVNHANDSFLDGGEAPMYWMPLPTAVEYPTELHANRQAAHADEERTEGREVPSAPRVNIHE